MKNSEALKQLKAALAAMEDSALSNYNFRTEFIESLRVAIAALETMTPDWENAPKWAKWWAMDSDGAAYWYAFKPKVCGIEWEPADYEDAHERAKIIANWAQSLEKRTKNEKP